MRAERTLPGVTRAYRGEVLHCIDAPAADDPSAAIEHLPDGLLVVENGRIAGCGPFDTLAAGLDPAVEIVDYRGCLLSPGLIDTHVHYVQTDIIASCGSQLLDWLERFTFPAEQAFADPAVAADTADFFLRELWRNGTTTACVFGSVHKGSVSALFEAAHAARMRLIAGKVMMDRNCPEALADTPASSFEDSSALIEDWHGHGRLAYAVTPRFAATSSPAQLERAAALLDAYDGLYMQTHVAENRAEVERIAQLYPEARSYLDVYERAGLLNGRAVLAHCIYLDDEDRRLMARRGAAASFCPSSNLFLGSGLFDIPAADAAGMGFALGSDVGGGTSFSMLATQHAAYGIAQLGGYTLQPARSWYLATLGGARALRLDRAIGNFETGKDADFIVLDPAATPLLERRCAAAGDVMERLFALLILGDDRAVRATYIDGVRVHDRDHG
ncbi:MAG: guanine deaminase [Gammaproteobacteria bacterium]|nr:guanine deaminase [Gammaproteobacteria bacterium]